VAVEPGPNRFRIVDIPIAPGGVIDGRVVRPDSSGAEAVTLRLTHLGTGAVRLVTTFRDGDFYAMGIRPGQYRLDLDPRVVARLGISAEALEFAMPAEVDGATVGGLRLVIR
jgi:hypothetical protein